LGLEEEANKLKAQGLSDYEIAEQLSKLAGVKITQSTVWRYFNSNRDAVLIRIKQREDIVEKAINHRFDRLEQLTQINRIAWEMLNKALKENNIRLIKSFLREIREQIELQAKILGDISDQPVINIHINNEFIQFRKIVIETICDDCRARLEQKLQQLAEGS